MSDDNLAARPAPTTQPRAVGAPLPRGGAPHPVPSAQLPSSNGVAASGNGVHRPALLSGMQRAAGALRAAVPFVQRLLPLLEGNVVAAVSNVLAPQAPSSAPPADTTALENGMVELHLQQRALGQQVAEQQTSLKRVEDHLKMVREATDRNTLEQQELMEDLQKMGRKVNRVAVAALVLLLVSVLLNVFLCLRMTHLLP